MANDVVNILLVEDSAHDAELLWRELGREGRTVAHERVASKAGFLAALQSQSWDAVISDYVLPQFSGPEALRLLREAGADTPFIMISGIYGEEEAVATMKDGANDYVMKANLSRLAPALDRELRAAEDRRRRRRAEGARQLLAAIVESSADAICGENLEDRIVSWNPAAERLFGYRAEEIVGQPGGLLVPESRREEMAGILAGVRRGETVAELETERLRKNGAVFPACVTVSPIRSQAGNVLGASSIVRDISRQKQAEAERTELIRHLQAAAQQVRALTGLLAMCATCKRIRDDGGSWHQLEVYLARRAEIRFSHSICPECASDYERNFEYKMR
jgi:PAS domain S-box-containing protein